jgi:predicted 2-oxoglutarate/Fe(II)-dependent dioxygenase YbiX
MNKVETGSNHIFRYDNVLDAATCDQICKYLLNEKGDHTKSDSLDVPWFDNDVLNYRTIGDIYIRNKIQLYRHYVKNLVMISFNKPVFIEYTDLVIWREGKSQDRHKDDGYKENDPLRVRKFTSVTYLNDDFEGGHTFIETEHGDDYMSVPKKGSVVIYVSDERAKHGVTKITKGIRITLPIWFCIDHSYSEEKKTGE